MILNLFSGPGGLDQGARVLDLKAPIRGYDIDADACATAVAAGFERTQASVTGLNPDDFDDAEGAIITPPCPTFSASGLGTGRRDMDLLRDAMTAIGDNACGWRDTPDDAHQALCAMAKDRRSGLVVESLRWALRLPNLEWVVCEQVPAVAPLWEEVAYELAATDYYRFCAVIKVAAEDLGAPSRRTRTFLLAHRSETPDLSGLPMRDLWTCGRTDAPWRFGPQRGERFPTTTMAAALGWPAGELVNTRGNRKTSGGNVFSADGLSWCLTEKARSWYRVSDGLRLTESDAGRLMGFPTDFPWSGSRSKCFLQAADTVCPMVAAAVLGALLGLDWVRRVRDYMDSLRWFQPSLFAEVA